MRGLKIGAAVVAALVALWVVSPAFQGYHIGQASGDTLCLSRVFDWCKDGSISTTDGAAQQPAATIPVPSDGMCPLNFSYIGDNCVADPGQGVGPSGTMTTP
jgi:hypothetical protein